ncbi:MAG TPA: aldehyde dehydrogenase family protein [Rectinemataceae bacterium]|nr:aldehyde dehydrogenase family protein [Rectinemataceae bacterium]
MANLADDIRLVVEQVLKSPDISALLNASTSGAAPAAPGAAPLPAAPVATAAAGMPGIFSDVDQAVAAAAIAQRELVALPLDTRKGMIAAMRRVILWNNTDLSTQAVAETGLGNVADKQIKNALAATKTPGVEDIAPSASTDEHGLTLTEHAPWGVIGAITPVTNPIATITCNAIGMIAAGNSVVFNVHPNAKDISCRLVRMFNDAIVSEGGPRNLLCAVGNPTIESAGSLMKHRGISLLVVTGGPGVVAAAMGSGKKAICAGPGNPPCVVDSTADIVKAGRDIVAGASFDHNIVCICEKEVLAVASIADRLKEEMRKNGAFELTGAQIDAVTKLVIAEPGGPGRDGSPNKAYVGKSPQYIARAAGIEVPAATKLLLMEVGREHPLVWTEQLMPVLPLVRMSTVDEAIDFAVIVERGCRHSAMIHSHDIEKLSRMAKAMNCSLFIKNGPCYAGLGQGGAGYTSFTIASPTGEGITRPLTFTRERRCTLVDAFRII